MLKARPQEPPFCVQVEFTEGCNLRCTFCGIQGITEKQGGPYKFMAVSTAQAVAASMATAKWNSRIEFAMHGEPTLNPNMVQLVQAFSIALPRNQLMMTSNGSGLLRGGDAAANVQALFAAGLNLLALDDYKGVHIVERILASLTKAKMPYIRYPQEGLQYSPHHRWKHGTHQVIVIQDLEEAAQGSHAKITNHAGCGGPLDFSKAGQRCAKPFREFAVRWDGTVAGCCNDWRGVFKVGNASKVPVAELWNGPALVAMRKKLYRGERDFGACHGCDYVTYRNGLLPDMKGKQTLARPNEEDNKAIKKACAGDTLSLVVIRPWEEK